jgi:hypothetical protein
MGSVGTAVHFSPEGIALFAFGHYKYADILAAMLA